MEQMKVTIIVPVFKAHNYIEKCADTLLSQTYDNIEYFFVNDCTPDDSMALLQNVIDKHPERKPNVMIINFETNQGHAHARNVALKQSTGNYIIQIDADDWVELDLIEKLTSKAIKEDADIVCCGYVVEKGNSREEHVINPEDIGCKGLSEYKFTLDYSAHWNKLMKASLIKDNEIYCIEGTNNWVDVGQVVPLRLMANKVVTIDDILYHYNATNENSVSKRITDRRIDDMIRIAQVVSNFIIDHSKNNMNVQAQYLKFYAKTHLITAERHDYKRWRQTFPDSNIYIFKYPISLTHKVVYFLASLHLGFVYELLKRVRR